MRLFWIILTVGLACCIDDGKTVIYLIDGESVSPMGQSVYLYQNYPNPFNPTTTIRYDVSSPRRVRIKVWTYDWQEVATLINRHEEAGIYQVTFDADGVASGDYYYTLETDDVQIVRRMKLIK